MGLRHYLDQSEQSAIEGIEKLVSYHLFNQSITVDMESWVVRVHSVMSYDDWQNAGAIARGRTDKIKSQAERIAYLESRVMELKEEVRRARLT